MGILPDDYLDNVTKKDYLKDAEKKGNSNQEVKKTEESRLENYLKLCMSGFVTLYWSDTVRTLEENRLTHPALLYICHSCFLIGAIVMLIGAVAAQFPSTTPCKMGFAGLGAWISFVFALGTFHLQTLKAHLEPSHALGSMILSTYLISMFWGVSAQDPVVLHVIAKYNVWMFSLPADVVIYLCHSMSDLVKRLGMEGVITCFTSLKGYLPSYPPFLSEDFLSATKGYLKGNQEDEEIEQRRLEKYFSTCLSGITSLYWGAAANMIMELHKTHAAEAYGCVLYSLMALVLTLVGVIASSFPSSTPCKMGFAGLGAWQALIFVVVTYHLATFKLHLEPSYSIVTMCASSLFVSVFWAIAGQDPIGLLMVLKYTVWSFCWIPYCFYRLLCRIVSGPGIAWKKGCEGLGSLKDRLFRSRSGGDPSLQAPLVAVADPQAP